jgi:hypothetical protein
MSLPRARRRRSLAALAPAALLLLAACVPIFSNVRTGALLPEERIRAIHDGKTTRRDLLDAFGPPLVVVRREPPMARMPDVELRRSGGSEVPVAWFFDRFADARPLGADHVVYYYRAHELQTHMVGAYLVAPGGGAAIPFDSSDERRQDRLWILLDDRTGVVEAHGHVRDGPAERVLEQAER